MTIDLFGNERLRRGLDPVPSRVDHYEILSFNEESDPELAHLAWAIHAMGYRNMQLVKSSAIDGDQLNENIDKSRGPSVEYFLALRENEHTPAALSAIQNGNFDSPEALSLDAATMRKGHIPEGGSIDDLPAYQLAKGNLYPEAEDFLRSIDSPEKHIKEIAALTPTQARSKVGVYELMRNAVQAAQGDKELWICTIVSTTNEALSKGFGPGVMMQIGEELAMDDPRVVDDIKLVPVAIDIDNLLAKNYENYMKETHPSLKERQKRSFMYFSEGLDSDKMAPELVQARSQMLHGESA